MSRPRLDVDVQRGFINQSTRHIPACVARLIEIGEFDPLLFTGFVKRACRAGQRHPAPHPAEHPGGEDHARGDGQYDQTRQQDQQRSD